MTLKNLIEGDRIEPDEGKLSRPVLRGGGDGNVTPLPDPVLGFAVTGL